MLKIRVLTCLKEKWQILVKKLEQTLKRACSEIFERKLFFKLLKIKRSEVRSTLQFQLHQRVTERDSVVGIVTGYGLDGHLSLHHSVETGSAAHPASYPMETGGSFP
jgi:hypothetical protein